MTHPIVRRLLATSVVLCVFLFTSAQTSTHDIVKQEGVENIDASNDVHADEHQVAHEDSHDHEFNAGDYIIHHIADANEIHFFGEGENSFSAPLPMIFYVQDQSVFDVFLSNKFKSADGGHNSHDTLRATSAKTGITYVKPPGGAIFTEGKEKVWDISITKSVFGMFFILTVLILILWSMAKSYSRRPGLAPTGLANVLEPLVLFVRDEIAVPSIGKEKSKKYMPFLLTSFFFIVACNLLGLVPFIGGFNITGTIGVTIVLATMVFIITIFNGNRLYWGHLFSPPGVPAAVKLLVVPIEIFGTLLKPVVLMIRLTANMSAGHIIILSFVSLIYIFNNDFGVGGGLGIGVFSTLFMIFMYFLELLVAFLQAYVFTLLAAIYFGDAVQEPHH